MQDSTLLRCENVTLSYEGQAVIRGLNFELHSGDYLCVVGDSGSGKSTLIKALLGHKRPDSGTLEYGASIKTGDIGFLPQQTMFDRQFSASVREVIMTGFLTRRRLFMRYTRAERERCGEVMQILGLESLSDRRYRQLSGGQQQRVLLARALCVTSRVLVLDEPVAGLDALAAAEMYHLIRRVNRQYGIAIVMVTKDISAAIEQSTHILHLEQGQCAYYGRTEDYTGSYVH